MKLFNIIVGLFAALSLAACGPQGGIVSPGTVATINAAAKDTIHLSFEALDAVAQTSKALVLVGVIKPGSQTAITIADGLDKTRNLLNAASQAQQAGNSGEYLRAISEARKAFAVVKDALNNPG